MPQCIMLHYLFKNSSLNKKSILLHTVYMLNIGITRIIPIINSKEDLPVQWLLPESQQTIEIPECISLKYSHYFAGFF